MIVDEKVVLTKEEIGDAISMYIGTFKKGKSFYPYFICDTEARLNMPDSVTFSMSYIPKGTRDLEHNI